MVSNTGEQGSVKLKACQQSAQWTVGILRHFRALSTSEQNLGLGVSSMPATAQVTQTVETVEKVGN